MPIPYRELTASLRGSLLDLRLIHLVATKCHVGALMVTSAI